MTQLCAKNRGQKQPLPGAGTAAKGKSKIILQLCAEHFEQKEKDTNEANPHKSKIEAI